MSKRNILKWVIPVAGILIAIGAFGYLKLVTWNPERQKVALINGRAITVAQFGREISKVQPPYQEMVKEDPKQFLEELIIKEVLLQEARRQGLKNDSATSGEQADLSLIQGLLKKEVLDKIKVTPEEIEKIYREHKEELGKKSLAEVSPFIESAVREMKGKTQVEEYLGSLKKKASVEIDEKRLQKIAAPAPATNTGEEFRKALKSGKPVLVDFGANTCMPCRLMRPILKEIEKDYGGKAHILVVDVYKYQDLAREYRVQLIPTLIFFDKAGKEVFRHLGAWEKEAIVTKLKEAGAV